LVFLFFAGIIGNGLAYVLQMIGQKEINAVECSLNLCLESPISVIAGLFVGQIPNIIEIVGCAIMFVAFLYTVRISDSESP